MLQSISIPLLDGSHQEVAVDGIGPRNKHLLSLVIHLNYVRLGYVNALPVQPVGMDVVNMQGELLVSVGVRNICERDLWDWLLLVFPFDWDAVNFRMGSRAFPDDGEVQYIQQRRRGNLTDEMPSCCCMGVTRNAYFVDLIGAAQSEFRRSYGVNKNAA